MTHKRLQYQSQDFDKRELPFQHLALKKIYCQFPTDA